MNTILPKLTQEQINKLKTTPTQSMIEGVTLSSYLEKIKTTK